MSSPILQIPLSRKLFSQSDHQNFLLSERELQIKQFQTILSYKPTQIIKYEDGTLYKGQLSQNNIRHGIGMLITPDNSIYMGKWKNNIYHEEGTYLYADGERYEGEIFEGMKDGVGKMYYINGDVYEGEWVEDCRDGKGEMGYACGDRYVGEWKDNVPCGEGVYYSGIKVLAQGKFDNLQLIQGKVSTQQYQGEWRHNTPHGKGTYKFEDGSVYTGQWRNGEKQGNGQYFYTNGDYFIGSFRNGYKQGKGKYKYVTGDQYEGEFYLDCKFGHGTMRFINGDEYKGEWARDLFHGTGVYTFSTGEAIKGKFRYGLPENMSFSQINIKQKAVSLADLSKFQQQKQKYQKFSPIKVQKNYSNIIKSHKKTQSNVNKFYNSNHMHAQDTVNEKTIINGNMNSQISGKSFSEKY